jgi:hypothetical protein
MGRVAVIIALALAACAETVPVWVGADGAPLAPAAQEAAYRQCQARYYSPRSAVLAQRGWWADRDVSPRSRGDPRIGHNAITDPVYPWWDPPTGPGDITVGGAELSACMHAQGYRRADEAPP